jgi:para-aminobenzoate synthetase component 1
MSARLPRRHRFRTRDTPAVLFGRLPRGERFRFATSATSPTRFGAEPVAVVRVPAGGRSATSPAAALEADALRALMPRVPPPRGGSIAFPGGAVGWVTWEQGHRVEGLSPRPGDGRHPEVRFGVHDTFASHDPATGEVEVASWGLVPGEGYDPDLALARARALEERLRTPAANERPGGTPAADGGAGGVGPPGSVPRRSLEESAHAGAVREILAAIARGDVYQADLTVRFEVETDEPGEAIFERLLAANPAPHSAYVEGDGAAVVSSSPERLLAVRERRVETRPIKGTRARHADPERDRAAGEALLASTKDRAELLMITDLLRNDLGKVCDWGTVRCPRLRDLESFPHVHHLVSTIEGRLRSDVDVFDALAAVFPGGSVAGAPKRRAMELLSDLEPAPRGVYTGTVGWIGFDRSADLAVAIRTGTLADGVFAFGAGGGIVADSTPDAEWRELLLKARAFLRALGADDDATAPAPAVLTETS